MDPFGTAELRERVLAAWSASPARFREDANAEDELVRGAYRDRVIVELAQNAADAGVRAGQPTRLLLRLDGATLIAANTGAALDAAGVEGLSTLRASPKRDDASVGRFGVGFASVLAVTDEPAVLTAAGGVRWSAAAALDLVRRAAAEAPGLASELDRRGPAVPVLRLPFPAAGSRLGHGLPAGYDTAVVLPLRDADAVRLVRRLLDEIDDTLLLALPNLAEVVVDVDGAVTHWHAEPPVDVPLNDAFWRVVHPSGSGEGWTTLQERRIGERTWRLSSRAGVLAADVLADRPLEERSRPGWSVMVAVPVDAAGGPLPLPESMARVLHAPTPTDDQADVPALIIATLPLDSSRRRVAPGQLADHVVDEIGQAYASLVASFTAEPTVSAEEGDGPPASDVLGLVPAPIGLGAVDTAVRRAIRQALSATPFVPAAGGGVLRPTEVNLIDGLAAAADPAALADVVAGLAAPDWSRDGMLRGLGATVTPLEDLVDELASLSLDAQGWRSLYDALDGADVEALAALPVPLADGRTVRGPRGLLLPGEVDARLMVPFDLRVVAPDAVHPLLRRLGAVEASAAAVLRDPMVRAAVVAGPDADATDDDPQSMADAVLALVADSGLTVADEPWLGDLLLPDETGHLAAARDLLLPGSPLLAALDEDPAEHTVDPAVVERAGPATLRAVGVRDGLTTMREADVWLDGEVWHDLDDEDGWVASVIGAVDGDEPPVVTEFVAVRDLDLIRDDAWGEVLGWLAADPETHAAVVTPALLMLSDGSRRSMPSYPAWWLREHARIDGFPLSRLCLASADRVTRTLLRPVELPVDDAFAAAVGVAGRIADVSGDVLLDRLADPELELSAVDLTEIYAALMDRDAAVAPPDLVRVPDGRGTRIVAATEAVVCDGPHWLQLGIGEAIPGPVALADVLDVDLASEVFDAPLPADGDRRPVPEVVKAVLAGAPSHYLEHDDLRVGETPVAWWVADDVVHACTADGLARGLAWAARQWDRRWIVAEALRAPDSLPALLAEDAF